MRHGTPGVVAAPRGAYAVRCDVCIFIYRKYNVYRTYKSSDYWKYTIPLIPLHIINPPPSFNLIRVGLSSTEFLNVQVTWLKLDRRIEQRTTG